MALLLLATVLGAGPAAAATIFEAELMPEYVVPPASVDAYGQATLIVSDDQSTAHLTVNFAGLDTPQTAASLLRAATGEPGVELEALPLGSPLALVIDADDELADALDVQQLAIRIASEAWPDGAIRGNFVFVTVSVDETTWSRVKKLFQ
jgi:hypothetical protein